MGISVEFHMFHVVVLTFSGILMFDLPVRFGGDVRAEMLRGVNVLADAVAVSIVLKPSFSLYS